MTSVEQAKTWVRVTQGDRGLIVGPGKSWPGTPAGVGCLLCVVGLWSFYSSLVYRSTLCELPSPRCLCGLNNVHLLRFLCNWDFMFFTMVTKIASGISFSSERFITIDFLFSSGSLPLWASKAVALPGSVAISSKLQKKKNLFFLSFFLGILELFLLEISHCHYPYTFVGTIIPFFFCILIDLPAPRKFPFTSFSKAFPEHHFHEQSTFHKYLLGAYSAGKREYRIQ